MYVQGRAFDSHGFGKIQCKRSEVDGDYIVLKPVQQRSLDRFVASFYVEHQKSQYHTWASPTNVKVSYTNKAIV